MDKYYRLLNATGENNGIVIHDSDGYLTYLVQGIDDEGILTPGQQGFLAKLLECCKRPCKFKDIYESYSLRSRDTHDYDTPVPVLVRRVRNSFPKEVRESIVSCRSYGYKVNAEEMNSYHGTENTEDSFASSETENMDVHCQPLSCADSNELSNNSFRTGRFSDLAGDYFCFYLSPNSIRDEIPAVWGAYLHIEEELDFENPKLKAYAVYGIRNDDVLHSMSIQNIFSQREVSYVDAYWKYRSTPEGNSSRCFYAEGDVEQEGKIAVITLKRPDSIERWMLLFSMGAYMKCKRLHEKDSDDCQGGMGLALAINATHKTRCFRFGIVRRTCWKQTVVLTNKSIQNQLRIGDDGASAMWKPLKLDEELDKSWHEWIMSQ